MVIAKSSSSKRANINPTTEGFTVPSTGPSAVNTKIDNLNFTSSSSTPKIDPFSHSHLNVSKKTFSGAKWIGVGLFAVVFSVYGFTMHQLTQEDFSDITIPESIKQQRQKEE